MANTASAKKRIKQTAKKTILNKSRMNQLRTFVKKVEDAISDNNKEVATKTFEMAQSVIAKTAQKGTIHKNTAKRKISRLYARIKSLT